MVKDRMPSPLRLGTRQSCSLSQLLFKIVPKVLARAIKKEKKEKRKKASRLEKKEVKLYL